MNPNVNVYVSYHDANFTCTQGGGNCPASVPIYFKAEAFAPAYDFSCGTHYFTWLFGDGGSGSGQSPTHTYGGSGTYPVSLQIQAPNGSSVNLSANVVVGAGGPTPPTPTPPTPTPPTPTPGGCSALVPGTSVYIDYQGPSSGCTEYSGDCNTTETLPFTVKAFTYDFGCASHSFQWDFGDNSSPGLSRSVNHRYVSPGAYNVSCTITVNGQAKLLTQTVRVSGQSGAQPPDYAFDFAAQTIPGVANGFIFTAVARGSGSTANQVYTWDFGDGHSDTTTAVTTTHIYTDSKNYTVTLTVSGFPGSVTHSVATRKRSAHH